jgi:hypothetical protein
LNKILPYREILPEELYMDLLKLFLNQDYKPSTQQIIKQFGINSNIITFQHAELISKWIDRLRITDEVKNSYKFKLMLRGSRDGFTSEKLIP